MPHLTVRVHGRDALLLWGCAQVQVRLDNEPLLCGISKLIRDVRKIASIFVRLTDVPFSTTRQVFAAINTIAWARGLKVNGKKQLRATYSGKPNITKPRT